MSITTREGIVTFNPALVGELAEKLYRNYTDAFREYWCNAYDVDSLKVDTKINPYEVIIEDWGTGIEDFDRFWEIGSPHKRELNVTSILKRSVIGSKGIGKLSFRKIGEKVEAVTKTQNGRAYYSTVDFKQGKHFTSEYKTRKDIEATLSHVGTKFKISELTRKIESKEVAEYCQETMYGLMLPGIVTREPMTIIVNQKTVEAKPMKGKRFEIDCSYRKKTYGKITGILSPSKKTSLDVLRRGVKVKEINPAFAHPVEGFVNVDWLEPTTDRHDFLMDSEEYKVFYFTIRDYLIKNFPSSEEIISKRKMKTIRYLADLMGDVVREVGLPEGIALPEIKDQQPKIGQSSLINPTEEKSAEKPYENIPHLTLSTKPTPIKPVGKPFRSKYGISWSQGHFGENERAVLVDTFTRAVAFNLDHDLLRKCDDLDRREQAVAFAPLFSRGYGLVMKKNEEGMEPFEIFMDNVTARLISRIKSSQ